MEVIATMTRVELMIIIVKIKVANFRSNARNMNYADFF